MGFYLLSNCQATLSRSLFVNQHPVVRGPLSGDPYGRVFRTEMAPLVAGSLTANSLWYADGTSASAIFLSVDEPTGTVLTSASPTQGLLADYSFAEVTDMQLQGICQDGLALLESRWPRGFRWTSGSLTDASGADPTVGNGLTFSTSLAEQALLSRACEVKLAEIFARDAGRHSFLYRGSFGGILVDKSRQARDQRELLETLRAMLDEEIHAVAASYTDHTAVAIAPLISPDYFYNWRWQSDAKLWSFNRVVR